MATTDHAETTRTAPEPEQKPDEHEYAVGGFWHGVGERIGWFDVILPIIKHPVPPNTGWWYVLGSATLVVFIVQVVTGIGLATAYVPAAAQAYDSLQYITTQAMLGRFVRGVHDIGASAMVILIGLHAMRVFLFGSYKFPREINWLSGVVLLFATLGMAFTGQLLRWDQNGLWTVVILTQQVARTPLFGSALGHFIMGGDTIGGATLSRFFAWHVFWIPAIIFGVVGLHLYLVLHVGISEPPKSGRRVDPRSYRQWYERMLKREGVPFWPDAAWRDAVFGVLVIAAVVVLAIAVGPTELGKPPNPTIIEATPRPDWYFLWYFAALALIPPGFEDWVILLGPLLLIVLLLAIPFISNKGERSPLRRPWAVATCVLVVMMVAGYTVVGNIAPWSPNFGAQPLPAGVVGATSGPVADGAKLFHDKGCEYCHTIAGYGGQRGPDLTAVSDRLTQDQITIRILNGGTNMPAFGNNLTPQELSDLLAFLKTRRTK